MPPGGEVKDGAHGHHNPPLKMGAQPVHEYFLLGSAQGNPDDVRQVFIDSPGNSRVVKFIHRAERQFLKRHVLHAGIFPFQGPAKGIQRLAVSSQEHHSVFFHADGVAENLGAAVLGPVRMQQPFQVDGHPAAVANGQERSIQHIPVFPVALYLGKYMAVRHADVSGAPGTEHFVHAPENAFTVKFVSDVEIGLHTVFTHGQC